MEPIDISPLTRLPTTTIRSYRDEDFESAYRIIREIGTDRLGRDLRSWDKSFMELSSFMWVAIVDEAVVGFAGMSIPSDDFIYLHTDLVSPRFQGRGLGTLLTLTRFAALADDPIQSIGVLATEHSTSFYKRFGFEIEGEPQLDPFAGYHIHRMSREFTPVVGRSAESLLDELERVMFDISVSDDPFSKELEE
ncbi:MAG: GNAT family N-acetyltransferase [Verrucomicrobiales bacterium]|nr:GNAT family N-acetyltransferase [Verrucomicrobiales bacterium]